MNIKFTTAEASFCPRLKTREGHESHIEQPHLPIASLPCPSEPLEISTFPIEVRNETPLFRPKEIASLWLQLLVIQAQNGNFWSWDDIVKSHAQKTGSPQSRKVTNSVPPPPQRQISPGVVEDPKLAPLDEKAIIFLRYKLQKGFLSIDKSPTAEQLPELSRFLKKLEDTPDLEAKVVKSTEICKVLIAICKLDPVPGNEEFGVKTRCKALIERFEKRVESYDAVAQAEKAVETEPVLPPVMPEPAQEIADDVDQTPPICITQVTPNQCAEIEALAQACDPPLDPTVVELMCLLPQFSSKREREGYQIAPLARIHDTIEGLRRDPKNERKYEGWGPKMPPHVLQLADFSQESYGTALYVDTRTGDGLVIKEYNVIDPNTRDPKWEDLVFERKPIEELLQDWIDGFLTGTFIPAGRGAVFEEGPRYIAHRRMDFLRHKALLHEFDWPSSFPLQAPQYHKFLRRQKVLHETTFDENPRHTQSLSRKWMHAIYEWGSAAVLSFHADDVRRHELLELDNRVKEALEHHERRVEERRYALAADVPMLQDVMQPHHLYASCNIGDNGRVDITPEKILERFERVCAGCPQLVDEDTEKMREVLRRAHERQKLAKQGIYERDYWSEEDDDSTSDYDPDKEETDEDGMEVGEEYESDEDMEDLDVSILETDMEDDVELVRAKLDGYQIGS